MGGRGSGGSRGGGGGGGSTPDINKDLKGFSQVYKEKFEGMNDKELEKAYKNTQNAMNKESAKLAFEQNKLQKMREEYQKVKETDSDYKAKSDAFDKQIARVNDIQSMADAKTQIHYIARNERNNVRGNHTVNDIGKMTNGQLNSFYHKSYEQTERAKMKAYFTKNKKVKEKNLLKMNFHNDNFWKANDERTKRGLQTSKDW